MAAAALHSKVQSHREKGITDGTESSFNEILPEDWYLTAFTLEVVSPGAGPIYGYVTFGLGDRGLTLKEGTIRGAFNSNPLGLSWTGRLRIPPGGVLGTFYANNSGATQILVLEWMVEPP